MKTILVVGGAGYIGSHQVRFLLDKGCKVIVFDNLSYGHKECVDPRALFVKGDLLSLDDLQKLFSAHKIDAVMHFAGFIAVGESVQQPAKYYENNVAGSLNLLKAMMQFGVKRFIFSSTAAVYGIPERVPITEDQKLVPINPYGRTKLIIEQMLSDFEIAYGLKFVALRYFNASGAGYGIGEWHEPETHLIPCILSAAKDGKQVKMFGDDYPTEDGTCIRDYIHVVDLVRAHYLALELLFAKNESRIYNMGSGDGYSVKQVIDACREVTGMSVSVEVCPRRAGDPPMLVASSEKIGKELGWKPEFGLKDIISSAWDWHRKR